MLQQRESDLTKLSPAQYSKILQKQKKVLDRNTRIRMFLMAIKKQEEKEQKSDVKKESEKP